MSRPGFRFRHFASAVHSAAVIKEAWVMRHQYPSFGLAIIAITLIGLLAAPVGAAPAPVTVSGPSPFATCAIGGPGTNYPNAEVEPWIAINPANGKNLIGAWQQDRWDNGGAHGLVAGYSTNGGTTWTETPLPFSACAPGGLTYERASDPWVSIGPDGTAYTVSISFNQSNNNNAVAAATSTDGGETWGNVALLKADTGTTQFFNDKESITADPKIAGTAYAVWDRLQSPNANPYADLHAAAYTGPSFFAKTTDGGKTWSAATIIVNTAQNNQTIGNQIVVDPKTGTLYDFFDMIYNTGSNRNTPHGFNVAFIKSTDGGATWTQPQIVAQLETVGVPNTRTGDIIPEVAIDPATERLYAVWQDSRFNGGKYDEIAIATSDNGGATWSAPARVNDATGQPAFTAAVAVNSQGAVAVSYYQYLSQSSTSLPTNYLLKTSNDQGASFGSATTLKGLFEMTTAPNAEGYFVGDYEGLAARGASFQPFFVATNTGNNSNRTDVFSTGT